MASVIVGSPSSSASAANAKVLRRQNYQKDMNGFETISETYVIRSENRASIMPEKDTKHSVFSTAAIKYPRMAVETITFSEQDGGLMEMNVSYVGLTSSSGLPPAIVRIIPVTGAGVLGPPINIEAEFVTDVSETQLVKGQFSSLTQAIPSLGAKTIKMPRFINGTAMPEDPVTPFVQEGNSITAVFVYRYEGYIVNNIQATRRGQFLIAIVTFSEFAYTGGGISGGWGGRFSQ